MRTLFATTAIAAFTGSAAMASGPAPAPVQQPVIQPAPQAFNWTGGYVGLQAGALNGDVDWSAEGESGNGTFSVYEANPEPSGASGGIYGGYNWQGMGNTVFGVEAEYNWTNADAEGDVTRTEGGENPDGGRYRNTEAEITSTAAIRGRVGYAMDRTLVYVAGGAAFADLELSAYGGDNEQNLRHEFSESRSGWTLGAGVEHAFTDSIVGRLDYRYSDFGTESYVDEGCEKCGPWDVDIGLETHEIRAGVAWRF